MSIQVRNIHKRFGSFVALDDVSLDFPTGELVALLGPPALAVLVFELLLNATAMFNHANVRLPAGVSADVKASTSNGSITSDFELTTRTISKTKLDGRIGNGGPLIEVSTSNGSIRLMRR